MRTRADIYGIEAAELLREISMYPGILERQLCRFHPGKEDIVRNLLTHLKKKGRVAEAEYGGYYPYGKLPRAPDNSTVKSVWVLLDFIDRAEYHSPADFPVKIVFFANGEMYEIVYAAPGQEALVAYAMRQARENGSRRIMLVDEPGQIPMLDLPGVTGYCIVGPSGNVSYYRKDA